MSPLIDVLAALVHDAYVREKRSQGVTTLPSRHGTGDLMRPYDQLAAVDRADDLRSVHAVLAGLAEMPWVQVCDLLLSFRDDESLLAELRRSAHVADPPPDGLADRCADLATGEDRCDA